MPYVYSTLTCDNSYAQWKDAGTRKIVARSVKINGGHGVVNKHFITPQGVVTEVSEEELEFLKTVPAFQEHVKEGFIIYEQKKQEPEKVASKMKRRDKSAPKTESDFIMKVSNE